MAQRRSKVTGYFEQPHCILGSVTRIFSRRLPRNLSSFTKRDHLDLVSNQSACLIFAATSLCLLEVCSVAVLADTAHRYKRRISMNGLRFCFLVLLLFLCVVSSSAQTPSTDGWVVLPVGEYTALKRAAAPAEPQPAEPPVEAT